MYTFTYAYMCRFVCVIFVESKTNSGFANLPSSLIAFKLIAALMLIEKGLST
jgi:hypothetical protein